MPIVGNSKLSDQASKGKYFENLVQRICVLDKILLKQPRNLQKIKDKRFKYYYQIFFFTTMYDKKKNTDDKIECISQPN